MKNFYKIAIFSLVLGFATGAFAEANAPEISESETITQTVSERKSCDDIATEIAEMSAIEEPDEETLKTLDELKQKQRSICNKNAGARSGRTATKMRSRGQTNPSRIRPTEEESNSEEPSTPVNNQTCDTPDENGCCPGEKYTDMGDLGFNCCPENGGDCFPPIEITSDETTDNTTQTTSDTETEQPTTETVDETKIQEKIAENIAAGLCADGSEPNQFGCCGDEVFKEIEDMTFGCCPPDGGDCFPPIK